MWFLWSSFVLAVAYCCPTYLFLHWYRDRNLIELLAALSLWVFALRLFSGLREVLRWGQVLGVFGVSAVFSGFVLNFLARLFGDPLKAEPLSNSVVMAALLLSLGIHLVSVSRLLRRNGIGAPAAPTP